MELVRRKSLAVLGVVIGCSVLTPSASAITIEKSCTADGDTMWNTVYYFSSGSNWFVDKDVFTLESSAGNDSNVNIRVKGANGFVYFTWNSPDNLDGGNTYTKQIDVEARKTNNPYVTTQFRATVINVSVWTLASLAAITVSMSRFSGLPHVAWRRGV